MVAPTTAKEAFDRLASRLKTAEDTIALLVADAGLDLFEYSEWQQDPTQPLPPWFGEEPRVIRSSSTFDVSTT